MTMLYSANDVKYGRERAADVFRMICPRQPVPSSGALWPLAEILIRLRQLEELRLADGPGPTIVLDILEQADRCQRDMVRLHNAIKASAIGQEQRNAARARITNQQGESQ